MGPGRVYGRAAAAGPEAQGQARGFMLFSKEMRPRFFLPLAEDPPCPLADVSKRLGEIWRGLSDAGGPARLRRPAK